MLLHRGKCSCTAIKHTLPPQSSLLQYHSHSFCYSRIWTAAHMLGALMLVEARHGGSLMMQQVERTTPGAGINLLSNTATSVNRTGRD